MQIPILSGIYADQAPDFRTSYPRNMVPVPKVQGISNGYLRPADGIDLFGTGPGSCRGSIKWNGVLYMVMGPSLVRVDRDGTVVELGAVGGTGHVTMDYSFDCLSIACDGRLFYWDGVALTSVTDPDIGTVIDQLWVDGYFMTTDGEYLIVTELNDRYSVNPLKYGSSEVDPDPVWSLLKVRNEVYVLNRHTIEVFDNVGGENFPFQRIDGAQVPRGVIGTQACCLFAETIAFLGSGRNEAPSVYLVASGSAGKIATAEIETILKGYTEQQLSEVVLEARADKAHQQMLMHLPDQTWVYDAAASATIGEPVWFSLTTSVVGPGTYKARNFCWCYDQWIAGDPTSSRIGVMNSNISTHYGETIGWDFGTLMLYNASRGALIFELEMVVLPGRVQFGKNPVIWTSYSLDGQTWSQEFPKAAGKQGERLKRIAWRRQGKFRNYRIQRFRGTSDAHVAVARLEAQLEPLAA
ncbi:packaged DNA stabilization protein [Hydrogenophaga sp.]|uniref:packaged DNA stabilization protein n=1 Tax=Hydrogenophaga sp. TaxID=1904254 RepID=UPI003D09E486